MPVPGGKLETEMLSRREVSEIGAEQTDDQERRADDDMRAIDVAAEIEPCVAVFVGLHACKCQTKRNRQDQAPLQALPVVLEKRVMRPRDGRAGGEQDQGVEERQVPGVECFRSLWRPHSAEQLFARDL